MKLMKRNPFFPEFSRVFDDFLTRDLQSLAFNPSISSNNQTPAINVKESDKEFEIEVAAPGLKKEDFKVELNDNILNISGEQKSEKEHKEEHYTHKEFFYSNFARSFTLPKNVEPDMIEAKYENGLLQLHLPKKQELDENKAIKTIEII